MTVLLLKRKPLNSYVGIIRSIEYVSILYLLFWDGNHNLASQPRKCGNVHFHGALKRYASNGGIMGQQWPCSPAEDRLQQPRVAATNNCLQAAKHQTAFLIIQLNTKNTIMRRLQTLLLLYLFEKDSFRQPLKQLLIYPCQLHNLGFNRIGVPCPPLLQLDESVCKLMLPLETSHRIDVSRWNTSTLNTFFKG